jgi:EpsI family protein
MTISIKSIILLALMFASAALGYALRPTHKLADQRPNFSFEMMIPKTFGEWQELQQSTAQVIDAQKFEFISKIYKQTLSRTYTNSKGDRIMLSLAYVEDQSDSFGAHLPEVCYPSQGFQISDRNTIQLRTLNIQIPVIRMVAKLGPRVEPISYWLTVGDEVVDTSNQRKIAQLRFALHGAIPDGMLVRVSSIGNDTAREYEVQARFISDFGAAVPKNLRSLLLGQVGDF